MRIALDRSGDVARYLGKGWSGPEPGHVWATGNHSWLMLPAPEVRRACLLSLTAWPHRQAGTLERQRVHVAVNGYELAEFSLAAKTSLVSMVPREAIVGKAALCIRLRHPDNARPMDFPGSGSKDPRRLAVAYQVLEVTELDAEVERIAGGIRAALGKPSTIAPDQGDAAAGAARFQSIGDDCEFGFVQRELGLEPLGLFRFASIAIGDLTRGVQCGFDGIAAPECFDIVQYAHAPEHDYMARERTYGLYYHTYRQPQDIEAEALKTLEMQRLRFLARKFMEDVENADHLFVVKRKAPLLPEEVAGLVAAFRQRGRANVLWVREADAAHPAGSACWLVPGLLAGYVDRIDVSPLQTISLESWRAMCRSAHALWSGHGA